MLAKSSLFKRDSAPANDSRSALSSGQSPYASPAANAGKTVTSSQAYPKPAESTPAAGQAKSTMQQAEAPATDKPAGSRLIVGPDVKLKGAEILDCDTLVVEGRVEATMDSRVIQIANNGAFSGKVVIDVAEIHGTFDGELTAREQLIIHATGRVDGKIRYGKILIEEGGVLSGEVAALEQDNMKPARKPTPAVEAEASS